MKNRDEKMRLRFEQREDERLEKVMWARAKAEKYAAERELNEKERLHEEMVKRLLAIKEKDDEK